MQQPGNRFRQFVFSLLCLPLLAWFSSAQAGKVTDLYSADVLVAEKAVSVDPAVARQALEAVIIKVSGRRDVLNFPRLQPVLQNPLPLILKYSYQATNIPIREDQGHELLAQRLLIDFSPGLVEQRLKSAGVLPLGTTRPGVLVWLVEEKGGVREYLGREDDPVVLKAVKETAESRGLPVFRPLLDFEDENALPVSDSWGFFTDSIRQASARYQPDSILVGRLFSQSGSWRTQWLLIWGTEVKTFNGEGNSLTEQMEFAVNHAADTLFADFVRPAGGYGGDGVLLQVAGVQHLADYFQINSFLQGLPAIEKVTIQSLDQDQLILRLKVEGPLQQLQRSLSLNQRFVSETLLENRQAGDQPVLNYRWQG